MEAADLRLQGSRGWVLLGQAEHELVVRFAAFLLVLQRGVSPRVPLAIFRSFHAQQPQEPDQREQHYAPAPGERAKRSEAKRAVEP